jgi:hypothetical protein
MDGGSLAGGDNVRRMPAILAILRRLVLGFLLVWSAFVFLVHLQKALTDYDRRSVFLSDPVQWRFGMPQIDVLQRCFAEARPLIPPGSEVVFTSPKAEQADFYRWRWAAYALPEHDVIQPETGGAAEMAEYLISHRVPIRLPRAKLVKRLTGCQLFRVDPL